MPVNSTTIDSSLRMELQTGVDASGNPQYTNRTFNRVKPTALDQNVYDVATIIAGLQVNTLNGIQRINENDLVLSA